LIIGGEMDGLFTALALRESGKFESINVYEQTRTPSTAGAGLNIAPNGALLCNWLGIVLDGGRAAILDATREIMPDGTVSSRPLIYNLPENDSSGFHHMHRLDLLMCLHKRVGEFSPESGVKCPIQVHMRKRLNSTNWFLRLSWFRRWQHGRS
jgi:salicylate hydroxylase